MNNYEIWIGNYHLGQGFMPPTEPELLGTVMANSFEIACLKYELGGMLETIDRKDRNGEYISDQDKEWFYRWQTNYNSWTGKYYPTREEALKSFR
jgi:hypothetical protein